MITSVTKLDVDRQRFGMKGGGYVVRVAKTCGVVWYEAYAGDDGFIAKSWSISAAARAVWLQSGGRAAGKAEEEIPMTTWMNPEQLSLADSLVRQIKRWEGTTFAQVLEQGYANQVALVKEQVGIMCGAAD